MEQYSDFNNYIRIQMVYGVLTTAAQQAIASTVYAGVLSSGIYHPWWCFQLIISNLVSIRFWLIQLPLLFPLGLVALSTLQMLNNRSHHATSRLQFLLGAFSIPTLLKGLGYALFSISVPFTFLISSGQSLYRPCSIHQELRCFNAVNLYSVTCGIWYGFYYFFRYQLFPKQIRFPLIIQPKYSQIRFRLIPALKSSFRKTMVPNFYFVIIFYAVGSSVLTLFGKIYSCHLDPQDDSFITFLNPYVIIHAWCISSFVHFSMWSVSKCLKVYLTELHTFQLNGLVSALGSDNLFHQYHGFYALNLLSLGRIGNVLDIFSISQPGGIPHAWNAVLKESLQVVKQFQSEIELITGAKVAAPAQLIQSSPDRTASTMGLRRLTEGNYTLLKKCEAEPVSFVNERFQQFKNAFIALSPIRYFFTPVLEDQISAVLERSHHVIWAIDSLSLLTGRAMKEDRFGVVVSDIPNIISTILSLRSTLEKIKVGGPGKQRSRDRAGRMRAALLSSVNRGLCRIAVTYADYIDNLYLPPDALRALKAYLS